MRATETDARHYVEGHRAWERLYRLAARQKADLATYHADQAREWERRADLMAIEGLDLSPESLYAPCALTRTALYGEG